MGEWEPDTCGGVHREGGGACEKRGRPSVAVTGDGDERHREPSAQSKNVNGVPVMHIKRTSAHGAAPSPSYCKYTIHMLPHASDG